MVKLPQPSTREGDAVRGPVSYYDPDEVEPMVTAAVMYYQAHRSQAQIARHLGVSRPTVSRLLARARQLGIVRIEIVPPTADPGLGKDLQERLGLRGIHIAAGLADPDDPAPVLAGRLNDALAGIGLQPGDVLVVGWGRAIYSLGRYELAPLPGVVVVPALGGGAEDRPWFQANEITRRWAVTLHGTPRYLHAPAFVSSALKRSLVHEEGVHSTLDLWDRAKVALVGVGAYPKPDSSLGGGGGGRRGAGGGGGPRGGGAGGGARAPELRGRCAPAPEDVVLGAVNAGHPGGMLPLTRDSAASFHDGRLPDNVYVADASLFPESLGNPPILTIVAMANRIGRLRAGEVPSGRLVAAACER